MHGQLAAPALAAEKRWRAGDGCWRVRRAVCCVCWLHNCSAPQLPENMLHEGRREMGGEVSWVDAVTHRKARGSGQPVCISPHPYQRPPTARTVQSTSVRA